MVNLLLKKSYLHKDLKEITFNDLWNLHGIFTTMRVVGKSAKILFYKTHIDNLIRSLKVYKIQKKNLKKNIFKIIKLNIKKNKNYDHLLRVAVNKKIISISLLFNHKSNGSSIISLKSFSNLPATAPSSIL